MRIISLKEKLPGILLCLTIALLAWYAVELVPTLEIMGAPVMAVLLGMLLSLVLGSQVRFKSGISFTTKKILQLAVVLLGFGLNLSTVGKIGRSSLPVILATISTSLIVAFIMQ